MEKKETMDERRNDHPLAPVDIPIVPFVSSVSDGGAATNSADSSTASATKSLMEDARISPPHHNHNPPATSSAASSTIQNNNVVACTGVSSNSSGLLVNNPLNSLNPALLIQMTGDVLVRISGLNDSLPLQSQKVTRFHSRAPPSISIHDYLQRIVKYASLEPACLLLLLVYIDRMCDKHPEFCISSLTVHRFIITGCVVAAKSICDSYCTNTHYSKVGGLSVQEINLLELEFLFMIDWDLSCPLESLQKYYQKLHEQSKQLASMS